MDRQTELLEKEDPRYFAIDKFNTGLISVAKIEKINGKYLSFGLPSSSALFLNMALNSYNQVKLIKIEECFDDHPQGTWPDNHKMLFDFFELMMSQIVFSFTAIETFANIAIPEKYIYRHQRTDKKYTEEYSKYQAEQNLKLDVKLDKILPEIYSVKSPIGTKLWEKFQHHKKIRDRLIHLKSSDMSASGPEIKTIWGDLIRNQKVNYSEQSHQLIGHYFSKNGGSRWFKKFPY